MMINNDILNAIINCKHKAYLKKNQLEKLPKTDFDIVFDKLKKIQNSIIQKKLSVDTDLRQIDYLPNFRFEKHKTYLQILFKNSEANLILDGIYIDDKYPPH